MPAKRALGWITRIREFVFGMQDGVISTVGFLSGLQGAMDDRGVFMIAGLAQVLTGAFSMGIGAYLSTKAEKEVFEGLRETEESRRLEEPYVAQEELLRAFEEDGLSREEGYRVVSILNRNAGAFRKTFYEKVLGIGSPDFNKPLQAAAVMYMAFIVGGAFALFPYLLLTGPLALMLSVAFSCLALFGTGVFKGRLAQKPAFRSGLEFFFIAFLSALAGYAIGALLDVQIS